MEDINNVNQAPKAQKNNVRDRAPVIIIIVMLVLLLLCCCGLGVYRVITSLTGGIITLPWETETEDPYLYTEQGDTPPFTEPTTELDSYVWETAPWETILPPTDQGTSQAPSSVIGEITLSPWNDAYGIYTDFAGFENDFFRRTVNTDLLSLHYSLINPSAMGIKNYECSFGSCTPESYRKLLLQERNDLATLTSFDYNALTPNEQIVYDMLAYNLNADINGEKIIPYVEPLSGTNGVHLSLPITLSQYNFDSIQDVDNYLALLSDTKRYFADVVVFEDYKVEQGTFMSRTACKNVIKDCQTVVDAPIDESVLITSFQERLEILYSEGLIDDQIKSDYIKKNQELVTNEVYPAYDYLIEEMTHLEASATIEDGAPCYEYPDGKAYYEYLLTTSVGTNRAVDEIKKMIATQVVEDLTLMQEHISDSVEEELRTATVPQKDYSDILSDLESDQGDYFPIVFPLSYGIGEVPSYLESVTAPAFYMVPPIDDVNNTHNSIFINASSVAPDSLELYTTLAHEGFPGHLYQNNYFRNNCDDPLRKVIRCSGYSEGYATYAELMSYSWIDGLSNDAAIVASSNRSVTLAMHALMDIGVNYEGWDHEALADYISKNFGITDEDRLNEVTNTTFDHVAQEPANYLIYYVGYLEILNLRKDYMAANNLSEIDNNALMQFHTDLLKAGPLPFPVLRDHILPNNS